MNWWDNLTERLTLEHIGCGIIIALGAYGVYWLIFESSFTIKVLLGLLLVSGWYLLGTSGKGNDEEDDL